MMTGEVGAIDGIEPDPSVIRSWQRCALRLDPHSPPRSVARKRTSLATMFKAQSRLITIAIPYLEDIYQFVEGSDSAIMLADGAGCILTIGGDQAMANKLSDAGFDVGSYCAEATRGTTAFGLALVSAMPVQVVGPEHYFEVYHDFVSTAAPIHHSSGRIIGLLGIINPLESATSHTLALVMGVARAISNQMQADLYLEEANRHLSEVRAILEGISVGVITWDDQQIVNHINTQAASILGLNANALLGEPVTDALDLPQVISEAVQKNEQLDDMEVGFDFNGQSIYLSVALHRIFDGTNKPSGYVMMLRPIEEVRQLVYRQVGSDTLSFEHIPTHSNSMQLTIQQARVAARGMAPVLLRGETGVGKNRFARAIHNEGQHADKPFITVNCSTVPHELMASEFLGYGGGTLHDRPSKFELADGGTLLINQIESLSLEVQNVVLSAIETGKVTRPDSTYPTSVNVRLIATTTERLEDLISKGSFLADLFFRFGVFNIHVPPLRERPEDIPLLATSFLEGIAERANLAERVEIGDEAMDILCRYPWPGNVRELESTLESAFYQRYDNTIRPEGLPETVRQSWVMIGASASAKPPLSAADAEREAILRAGWACEGHISKMAQLLGIGRTTLWRKMKQMNITPGYFKL